MSNAIEAAVRTYLQAWSEPNPDVRASLLEECFAGNGRVVTNTRVIDGRQALGQVMTRVAPKFARMRLTGPIDVGRRTFHFRGVAEHSDGTVAEHFEAGEVDADGKIAFVVTFPASMGEDDVFVDD